MPSVDFESSSWSLISLSRASRAGLITARASLPARNCFGGFDRLTVGRVRHAGDVVVEEAGNPRAMERLRQCLTTRYASEVRQNTCIRIWIQRAVETETPMPVNNVT